MRKHFYKEKGLYYKNNKIFTPRETDKCDAFQMAMRIILALIQHSVSYVVFKSFFKLFIYFLFNSF